MKREPKPGTVARIFNAIGWLTLYFAAVALTTPAKPMVPDDRDAELFGLLAILWFAADTWLRRRERHRSERRRHVTDEQAAFLLMGQKGGPQLPQDVQKLKTNA